MPVVLRRVPSEGKELYNFIGECYVHGIMDGEALNDGSEQEILLL